MALRVALQRVATNSAACTSRIFNRARYWWIAATTCAPSPTEAATLFTDPARTSPTAKTPHRLVSSDSRSSPASVPVHSKPRASSLSPEVRSQSVLRSEEHTSELQSLMRISYAVFCWKTQHINLQL